jgi:pyridoxal phosphate enzyme (YggS family)
MTESIKQRFDIVREKIYNACHRSTREIDEVKIVVVTKGQTITKINDVLNAGALYLGENYPEETLEKIKLIETNFNPYWHMIGHIQSRKIKMLYPTFSMIHSIDSIEVAKKVNDFYSSKNMKIQILIEINISGESSKNGFDGSTIHKRDLILNDYEELRKFDSLIPSGLMTMPPESKTGEENRVYFGLCKELLYKIQSKNNDEIFKELSMGTSFDYETAIEEGATFIRIGEAIMGERKIKNL